MAKEDLNVDHIPCLHLPRWLPHHTSPSRKFMQGVWKAVSADPHLLLCAFGKEGILHCCLAVGSWLGLLVLHILECLILRLLICCCSGLCFKGTF